MGQSRNTLGFEMMFSVVAALLAVSYGVALPQGFNPAITVAIQKSLNQHHAAEVSPELTKSITDSILQGITAANSASNPSAAIKASIDAALANPDLPSQDRAGVQAVVDSTQQIIDAIAKS